MHFTYMCSVFVFLASHQSALAEVDYGIAVLLCLLYSDQNWTILLHLSVDIEQEDHLLDNKSEMKNQFLILSL